jgi:hypothetical protein
MEDHWLLDLICQSQNHGQKVNLFIPALAIHIRIDLKPHLSDGNAVWQFREAFELFEASSISQIHRFRMPSHSHTLDNFVSS